MKTRNGLELTVRQGESDARRGPLNGVLVAITDPLRHINLQTLEADIAPTKARALAFELLRCADVAEGRATGGPKR